MNTNEKCSQCLLLFSEGKLLVKLPSCQHHICQICLKQVLAGKFEMIVCSLCSVFSKKQDIKLETIPDEDLIKSYHQVTKKNKEIPQTSENECEGILLDCEDESSKHVEDNNNSCKIHNILMDIICISDRVRICPHCALFGNHKDHRFKRIQDFQKETKEKMKIFEDIMAQKTAFYLSVNQDSFKVIEECVNASKTKIKREISTKIQNFIECLKQKQKKLQQEVDSTHQKLLQFLNSQPYIKKKQSLHLRLNKWQQECISTKKLIMSANKLENQISYYYNSSLQLAAEGSIFLKELKNITQAGNRNMSNRAKQIRVLVDTEMQKVIEKCIKLQKFNENHYIIDMEFMQQHLSDSNPPFMDCTSSQIGLNSMETILNNQSIEMDITNIANSCKMINHELTKTIKKPTLSSKQEIKSMKSIEKRDSKPYLVPRKKLTQSPSKTFGKNSRISETAKSPSRIYNGGSLKSILPGTEIKSIQIKEPEKIYTQFSKNTLTDFFDISDCNLPSQKVVEYVQRARRIHKIRGLKLSSNHLNSQGFEKMIDSLKGVGNINLANNEITQSIFDLLFKNRDKVDALKIINLSHNPISFDKKTNTKIDELKKMGIIVIL